MPEPSRNWHQRYATGDTPWDSGLASLELQRIVQEGWVRQCRVLELGCGTGTNALFLAQQGFDVTAVDIVPQALDQARTKARQADVGVRFVEADVLALPDLGPSFPFVFDRGTYHIVRDVSLDRFRQTLVRATGPASLYLTLAGNANEINPPEGGPPRVSAQEICSELSPPFDLVQLREFHFDGVRVQGRELRPLAWSALFRRRPA